MGEPEAPSYYIVSRSLTEEQMALAEKVFQYTPISHSIVTSPYDATIAMRFTPFVVRVLPERAREAAEQARGPAILIGDAEFIDACYSDGRVESLKC